ncbi:plasminogen activator inhibitor 1 RNA-binding protein isoform X2 [Frankliniella occidentalis]|uniref:Plasminogen activator inhibitor 1 RNA-binding protein isoform X2 n=1 Tax=Frankliniella occidentalis TaxID=133901 RepID=A0A6J1T7D2_FRAOC|nr:plasminogen activator inhibitor 1 RNA-binding protein isoform X2 [Frankliniella occidentalis]
MEQSYGIGITNRFDLFLDEGDDPLEVLKIQEQEKEAKKKTKISEKENKGKPEIKAKVAPSERKGIKETSNVKTPSIGKPKEGLKGKEPRIGGPRPDGPRPPRGDRPVGDRPERNDRTVKFSSESREERNNRQNREDRPFNQSGGDFFSRDRDSAPRGDGERFAPRGRGGMGRGMGRGMRGGRGGYDNRGKREFDRQSGSDKTGVKAVDKREGGGAHNWGSHRDDIEELNSSATENPDWSEAKPEDTSVEAVSEPKEGEALPAAAATTEAGEEAVPAEEEPQELTLDEWKALQKSRSKPQYNLRKAGEGEDPSQWKKMYALDKKKEELEAEEDEELEEYDVSAEYPQRVGRLKHVLDIEVVFGDSRRGGRGRGRGGPRGMGRGRGGPAGEPRGPPREREFDATSYNENYQSRIGLRGKPRGPPPGGPVAAGPAGPAPMRRNDFNKPHARPPKVDDEHDFPSLG